MTTINLTMPSKAVVGEQFVAKVAVDTITNFDAANYDIDFDSTVLSIVAVNNGIIGSTTIPVDMWRDFGNGKLRIINNIPGITGVSGTGTLSEVVFEVISFKTNTTLNFSNGILGDNQAHQIQATWMGNALTVVVLGDVNGDGLVDSSDIIAIERIIVEFDPITASADVNADAVINCLDITTIKMIM